MRLAPIEVLLQCASKATGIDRSIILNRNRKRDLVTARQLVIIYMLSNYGRNYSIKEIANFVGLKEHSSVIVTRTSYFNLIESKDKNLLQSVELFKHNLKLVNPDFAINMTPPRKLTTYIHRHHKIANY